MQQINQMGPLLGSLRQPESFDVITGTSGDDKLVGGQSKDKISGLAGDDKLVGLGGKDHLLGGNGDDLLSGGKSDDALHGGAGSDTLMGGAGDDLLDGGAWYDLASFADAKSGVHVDLHLQFQAQDTGQGMDTLENIENLQGSAFADVLIGGSDFAVLVGGGGADLLDARDGGAFFGSVWGDGVTVRGGHGADFVQFDSGGSDPFASLTVDLNAQGAAQDTGAGLVTLFDVESLSAGWYDTGDDILTGNGGRNFLAGAAGDDQLSGGGGSDALYGDGALRPDFNPLDGDIVDFQQSGLGSGADTLDGGFDADTLVGGGGADSLTGGGGADSFVFFDITDSTVAAADTINDLHNVDLINLHDVDADVNTTGDQFFTLVEHFTGAAGQMVLTYDAGSNLTHLLLDVNGDGQADGDIQMVGDHTDFTAFIP